MHPYGSAFPDERRHLFPACVACVRPPDVAHIEDVALSCNL